VIALKLACGRRDALMVVLFNPRKEDWKVRRDWSTICWRLALAAFMVGLSVIVLR
jgi:hypothetical protein